MCVLNLIRDSHSKRPPSKPADSEGGVSVWTRQHQAFLTEGLPHPLVIEASEQQLLSPQAPRRGLTGLSLQEDVAWPLRTYQRVRKHVPRKDTAVVPAPRLF